MTILPTLRTRHARRRYRREVRTLVWFAGQTVPRSASDGTAPRSYVRSERLLSVDIRCWCNSGRSAGLYLLRNGRRRQDGFGGFI